MLTGIVHGPNGTAIKETDTTTLGGADNYKKVHDSTAQLSPKTIGLGGGKNTNLDNKNTTAGCKLLHLYNLPCNSICCRSHKQVCFIPAPILHLSRHI